MKQPQVVAGIILICMGPLMVLTGVAYTLMLPNIYASSVRISVQEGAPEVSPVDSGITNYPVYNPYFLRTQTEIIQSKPVLYEVINRLNLQEEWGMDGARLPREVALRLLQNSIEVYQLRDTSIIVISAKRTDPDEAADIANELALAYRDSRLDMEEQEHQAIYEAFMAAMAKQQTLVEEAEKRVQELRVQLDLSVESGDWSADVYELSMRQIFLDRLYAQQAMVEKQDLLKQVENILEHGVVVNAATITDDPEVVKLLQQLQDINVQMAQMDGNVSTNLPETDRLGQQKEQVVKVLSEPLQALQNRLQTEYDIAEGRFEKLDELVKMVTEKLAESNVDAYTSLSGALAELKSERFIYNQLNANMRLQAIAREVPRNPVELIDIAEPNRRPVSPNLFMNALVSLAVGGCVAVGGIVLLVLGLRKKHA